MGANLSCIKEKLKRRGYSEKAIEEILKMNRRLEKEFGERVAEKRVGVGLLPVLFWKFGEKPKRNVNINRLGLLSLFLFRFSLEY